MKQVRYPLPKSPFSLFSLYFFFLIASLMVINSLVLYWVVCHQQSLDPYYHVRNLSFIQSTCRVIIKENNWVCNKVIRACICFRAAPDCNLSLLLGYLTHGPQVRGWTDWAMILLWETPWQWSYFITTLTGPISSRHVMVSSSRKKHILCCFMLVSQVSRQLATHFWGNQMVLPFRHKCSTALLYCITAFIEYYLFLNFANQNIYYPSVILPIQISSNISLEPINSWSFGVFFGIRKYTKCHSLVVTIKPIIKFKTSSLQQRNQAIDHVYFTLLVVSTWENCYKSDSWSDQS